MGQLGNNSRLVAEASTLSPLERRDDTIVRQVVLSANPLGDICFSLAGPRAVPLQEILDIIETAERPWAGPSHTARWQQTGLVMVWIRSRALLERSLV